MHDKHDISFIGLIASLLLFSPSLSASSFVLEGDRPDRAWLSAFNGATQIKVNDSIEDALLQCPKQQYCELLVDQLVLSNTVEISRSKTRLTGIEGNRIRMRQSTQPAGFYFRLAHGVEQVIFSNLQFDGENIARDPEIFGIGSYDSHISHVLVSNNRFTKFHGLQNAHAIAFYGTGATDAAAINNIIIEKNQISDMRTGSSESIVINGNVRQWEIIGNDIQRVNNIAIDAIGGEGTAPTQILKDGRTAPGPFDAARFGFIENNTVTDMSTENNPAYGNKASWAAAIYIDGARSIKVSGNTVSNVPWGLDVGAENCITSSHIQLFNNTSINTHYGDILIGGYAEGGYLEDKNINCDPHTSKDISEGHGYVSNLDIRDNELKGNKSYSRLFLGNTVLQHRIEQSTIEPPYRVLNE